MMDPRILIVEDDRYIRKALARLLESEGYVVDVAENGQQALDNLHQAAELPQLIILDLMMPVLDGFQFRERQARLPRLAGIPVVIMTADGHIDAKKMRIGAVAALRKPADVEEILKTVKQHTLH